MPVGLNYPKVQRASIWHSSMRHFQRQVDAGMLPAPAQVAASLAQLVGTVTVAGDSLTPGHWHWQ